MTDNLRVTILSPYPFWILDQARQLHRADVLEKIVTAVPRSRVGLPAKRVSARLRWTALRRAARRVLPGADPALVRAVIRDFDRWAYGQIGQPCVVNGLSGFATDTLTRAGEQGITVCCDRGSWHILEQRRVLDEEADRIGAPREHFDPFIVDRELREYDLADRILTPSETARQSFLRRGIDSERVVTVPYGVDVSAFVTPSHGRRPGAIVSVGTVGLRKGQHHLIEAFRMLHTRGATLTLVGAVLPGWRRRLHLDQTGITTTGAVTRSRVVTELGRASVFVLASVEEGLALVIAQAMACGLPVIATEATGVRELITDGVEGIVVPRADSALLASAIDALLTDRERARAMGAAARCKVESLGGWDRYGRQLVATMRAARLSPPG